MAKHKLNTKHFFTLTALSATLLIMFFVTGIINTPTTTRSDATFTSGYSLNNCTGLSDGSHYFYAGGVKLYQKDNYQGGDRVMCVLHPTSANKWFVDTDTTFKDKDDKYADATTDIGGNFQGAGGTNGVESLKIRARAGCLVNVSLYSEYNLPDRSLMVRYSVDRRGQSTDHTKSIELPEKFDNWAKSLKISTICDEGVSY